MNSRLIVAALFFLSIQFSAQNFTWMRGSAFMKQTGSYGAQSIPSPGNDPGARHGAATWVDTSGCLWIFGGEGYSNSNTLCWMNDLWKYDPLLNQWAWIRGSNGPNAAGVYGTMGVAHSSNEPGAREFMVSWTDSAGMFWMFGGEGFAATSTFGMLGDLWRYDPYNNMWTWMKGFNTVDQNGVYGTLGVAGQLNMPGCRKGSGYWTDSAGNFYLFGGRGYPANGQELFLNDLWTFRPATNNWTWLRGADFISQPGVYGTKGVTTASNQPGAREFPGCWVGDNGKFYLFGGAGQPASMLQGHLNDFWEYDPVTNNWTWIHGSNLNNQPGIYGTKGVTASSVTPGGRMSPACWKDLSGDLWMFGGFGYPSVGLHMNLSDLFRYNRQSNQWTWIKGPSTGNQPGDYGTQGVAAITNNPGAREFNNWWTDNNGYFWLFGGLGHDDTTTWVLSADNMNDLWGFNVPCNPDSISLLPGPSVCGNSSATLIAHNQLPSVVDWYTALTGTASIGSGSVLSTPVLTAGVAPATYTFFAASNSCTMAPRTSVVVTVQPLPVVVLNGPVALCEGDSIVVYAQGAVTYSWNTGSTSHSAVATAVAPATTVMVTGTGSNSCSNNSSMQITVHPLPDISIITPTATCDGLTATAQATGAVSYTWNTGSTTFSTTFLSQAPGKTLIVKGADSNNCVSGDTIFVAAPVPPVPIISSTHSVLCAGESAVLQAGGAASYSWNSGATGITQTVSPGITTHYTVTGINNNGCSGTATFTQVVVSCVGVAEQVQKQQVKIFPNPSLGEFIVEVTGARSETVLRVINVLGQVVEERLLYEGPNAIRVDLPAGLYYVFISDTIQNSIHTLVVVN